MKKTKSIIPLLITVIGIGLIGFQNFTRYKPRDNSRDARDLYMGDELSAALKDAEKAEQKRRTEIEAKLESPAKDSTEQAIDKPEKVERKTSSATGNPNGIAQ